MTLVAPDTTFQATDLARRAREVLDAARHPGGALIRDKDGTSFLVTPAGRASRERYALNGMQSAVRALSLLGADRDSRDAVLYGEMAWLAVLPDEEQRRFVWEYLRALETSLGVGLDPVEQLLYEWQQTARIYADADLFAALTGDLDQPLTDIEL